VSGGIGDPQVRNWGTIGGSVAHADPASDWPARCSPANATIVVRGKDGDRAIKARDFFLDTFTTAIEPTEVLTEIRIPRRRRASVAATASWSAGSATSRRSASRSSAGSLTTARSRASASA
jgi:CO/xanthine dehydrogenase FAD-binding subunit